LIRNGENLGFGSANNQGMKAARASWFLLLNSDAELVDDSVVRLLSEMRRDSSVGVGHCRLLSPDGTMQHTTYRFPGMSVALLDGLGLNHLLPRRFRDGLMGGYWDQSYDRDVDWVAGAFMLVRREVFEETGGFDEAIFMYGEDLEWCWRISDRGWRIRFYADAVVKHRNHASSDQRWGDKRIEICVERQHQILVARRGASSATASAAIGAVGACLRAVRYSVLALRSDENREDFSATAAYQRALVRNMGALCLRWMQRKVASLRGTVPNVAGGPGEQG
jgi:GT2 family glycosyltransferase